MRVIRAGGYETNHQAVRCYYMISVKGSESKRSILQCQLFNWRDFCISFEVWLLR